MPWSGYPVYPIAPAAEPAGIGVQTLRLYEQHGLITPPTARAARAATAATSGTPDTCTAAPSHHRRADHFTTRNHLPVEIGAQLSTNRPYSWASGGR
ncbi:hypothetical protein [Nocardia jinanensis]|uniref:HTH merR-type domain-containing protein n=1 Tax=Nocardia jinanensis TaxID=382504 RepID=A0A917RW12_9NOCA|nr:hypothetical protein GCM10011588_63520 [Nocardia jinanensis]